MSFSRLSTFCDVRGPAEALERAPARPRPSGGLIAHREVEHDEGRGPAKRGHEQRRVVFRLHERVKVVEDVHVVGPRGARHPHAIGPVSIAPYLGAPWAPLRRIASSLASVIGSPEIVKRAPARSIPASTAAWQARTAELGSVRIHGVPPRRTTSAIQRPTGSGSSSGACTGSGKGRPRRGWSTGPGGGSSGTRIEARGRRIHLREPARDPGAEAAELEHPVERRPAGDGVDGLHPVRPARRLEGQADVHAVIADECEVHQGHGRRAATPAARHGHVPPRERVPDHVRLRRDRQASADDRLPALALVHGEIDALAQERPGAPPPGPSGPRAARGRRTRSRRGAGAAGRRWRGSRRSRSRASARKSCSRCARRRASSSRASPRLSGWRSRRTTDPPARRPPAGRSRGGSRPGRSRRGSPPPSARAPGTVDRRASTCGDHVVTPAAKATAQPGAAARREAPPTLRSLRPRGKMTLVSLLRGGARPAQETLTPRASLVRGSGSSTPRIGSAAPSARHDAARGVRDVRRLLAGGTMAMIESMIAERMGRLGTETAFEVLARARALERAGEVRRPPRDRRAGLRHPGAHPRGGQAGARRGGDALRAVGRPARAARGDRRGHREDARHPGGARRGRRHARGQAHHVLRDHGPHEPRGRGDLPEPRLPHLRVGDQLRGRGAGADPPPRGDRLRLRPRGARAARLEEDQAHHHQLAREPDGRRAVARGRRPHRRPGAALPRARPLGRDLPALPLRRGVRLDREPPGHEAPDRSSWTASRSPTR